ncbi:MAG TPA: methyltransferase domain-containing protein [Candidatus Methanoperedens sp.]|nr:methyltransferase domain-containing protein [Candidatus Methanoperedens sp.]
MIKINLGSGPASASGWINYDWGLLPFMGKFKLTSLLVRLSILDKAYDWKWPKIELVDLRHEFPNEDKSVDYIYCSHVLEHFEKDEAINILKEARRVLKKKGVIRIVLPDLSKMIKYYKSSESFNREYFGFDKDLYVGFVGKLKRIFIRGHQWMYDVRSAKELMNLAGFGEVKLCSFRKGNLPDLKTLDIEQHAKIGLYLEASGK